jgi:hypothetical protein
MRHILVGTFLIGACSDPPQSTTADASIDSSVDAQQNPCARQALPHAETTLAVTNLAPGETLRYNLPLLRGNAVAGPVTITTASVTVSWPVVGGEWKALVPLTAGCNVVTLAADSETIQFALEFEEQTTDHYVRPVYAEGADGAGTFDAPSGISNTEADGVARVQIAAWMWQTYYAETMNRAGLGRVTFRLPLDTNGRPIVSVLRSTKTVAQLRAMTGGDVWSQLYGDFSGLPNRENVKDVVVTSFSHYDPGTMQTQASAALGGGHQAMMSGAVMFTWPPSLAAVAPAFVDTTTIDSTMFAVDSANRGPAYWASYTTTSGAMLHELGHTLGLPHDMDYASLMTRGFDGWNRTFMMSEPGTTPITDASLPVGLVKYQAVWLGADRWFTQGVAADPPTGVAISANGDTLTIASANGVRVVMFWDGNNTFAADEPQDVAQVTYSQAALHTRFPSASSIRLLVRDARGAGAEYTVP